MKTLPRIAVAFSTIGLAGLVFVQMQGMAIARPSATAMPALAAQSVSTAVAPPLVNLPDFSRLVEQAGPAVVNIEAISGGGRQPRIAQLDQDEAEGESQLPGDEEMPEIFRRFFGQPGQPGPRIPGMPGPGRRGGLAAQRVGDQLLHVLHQQTDERDVFGQDATLRVQHQAHGVAFIAKDRWRRREWSARAP